MFFKNAQVFRIKGGWNISSEKLAEQIKRRTFQGCGQQDRRARGWGPVKDDHLVMDVTGGVMLIALEIETKILPASVVNRIAAERAKAIQASAGYKPGRKQVREIKDAVEADLLPKALTKRSRIHAYIDTRNSWVVVDTNSPVAADEVIETLRECLEELPLHLVETNVSPSSAMTDWLASNDAPEGFTIDRDCELRAATEHKSFVRYANHSLAGDEIFNLISQGAIATKLAMTFSDRISFVLTSGFELKRLKFLDEVTTKVSDPTPESDLFLMASELRALLSSLVEALGGEGGEA